MQIDLWVMLPVGVLVGIGIELLACAIARPVIAALERRAGLDDSE